MVLLDRGTSVVHKRGLFRLEWAWQTARGLPESSTAGQSQPERSMASEGGTHTSRKRSLSLYQWSWSCVITFADACASLTHTHSIIHSHSHSEENVLTHTLRSIYRYSQTTHTHTTQGGNDWGFLLTVPTRAFARYSGMYTQLPRDRTG